MFKKTFMGKEKMFKMKKFDSISELIKDDVFVNSVRDRITKLKADRYNREPAKSGFRYIRDVHDVLSDEGKMNTHFFVSNIEKIWLKISNLNSKQRNFIQYVCNLSYQETVNFYSDKIETETTQKK